MDFYRNFNFEDYDKNGTDMVVVCEKKGTLKGRLPARNTASSEKASRPPKTISPKMRETQLTKAGTRASVPRQQRAAPKGLKQVARKSKKLPGKKAR